MNRQASRTWAHRLGAFACWMAMAGATAASAAAAKPSVYCDVRITFAGETFGFSGAQSSFSQSQDGGRIVVDVTTVGTYDYLPVPEIDTTTLSASGNHWEVAPKLENHSYLFVGTCASATLNTTDSTGATVRHLFLNCEDMSSSYVP
jgi:hypothetical protein